MTEDARPTFSLAAAALWYAEQGIAIFPLQPGAKLPLKGSHGCKDATTDTEQVCAWWAATPHANIGLATGHIFDVVDIDGALGQASRVEHWCYDKECAAAGVLPQPPSWWTPLCEHDGVFNKVERDTIAKVLTPRRGGMHIYVKATGKGNHANLKPGIDYRGRGGYVVAPPSRTEVGTYRFLGDGAPLAAFARQA